ncbi:RICIN domain-containing protein [Streptomyces sp. NBC_00637]|uniref:RICIN domain-containing protein n=1 Tax=Streptomyces sp. NBC_00637 TaxID=2903667 RepID=UPI00386E4E49
MAQPSGFFKVFNVARGKVLGVENQSTADGAKILQWDDNGALDHEWAVAPNPVGGYTLTNRVTGRILEIPNASTTAVPPPPSGAAPVAPAGAGTSRRPPRRRWAPDSTSSSTRTAASI